MRVFILVGETLDPTAVANPPACFRQAEWEGYTEIVTRLGFRVPGEQPGPSRRPKYLGRESFDALRQARALREQACADCTIAYQVAQRLAGRCHPVNFDRTPIGRALSEGGPDHVRDELDIEEPDPDERLPRGSPASGKHPPERLAQWRESARRRRLLAAEQQVAGL